MPCITVRNVGVEILSTNFLVFTDPQLDKNMFYTDENAMMTQIRQKKRIGFTGATTFFLFLYLPFASA